jgi:hypothetical protein
MMLSNSPPSILGDDAHSPKEMQTTSSIIHGFGTKDNLARGRVEYRQRSNGRSLIMAALALRPLQPFQQDEKSDYSEVPEGSRSY